jgi:hypothetical protein
VASLHEFGRAVNDLEYRAKNTNGAEDARAFLNEWLKDIAYEQHLYGLAGLAMHPRQRRLMAGFGIRGIGSIYYLMYAIKHGLDGREARTLVSLTLAVVVAPWWRMAYP